MPWDLLGISIVIAVVAGAGREVGPAASRSGPIAVTSDGRLVAVANPDSDSVSVVDTTTRSLRWEIPAGRNPQTVGIHPENGLAYVTSRDDDKVTVVHLGSGDVLGSFATADEPFGLLVSPDARIYVANEGADAVQVVDADTLETTATLSTEARPRGLALSPDGNRLYVSHFLSGALSVIDTNSLRIEKVISTGLDTNTSQSVVLDPSSRRAYLPQTRSNSTNPALLFDTTAFPVVTVVDLEKGETLLGERIAIDIVDRPASLPLDAVITSTNKLYVVNAGSNDVTIADLESVVGATHLEVGDNPRGLALSPDEESLYVNNTLSGTVSVIDVMSDRVVDEIPVTEIPLAKDSLNGKILFNSSARPELAKDRWISCATCHFDAEMDGRTWLFADGPRNSPSLLGVGETLPIHWSGDLDELQDVEGTIRNIQAGSGLAPGPGNCDPACDQAPPNAGRSQDLDDLATYMEQLRFTPNPNLDPDGSLSDAAERGRELFSSSAVGCAVCHPPPLFSDLEKHDVGTGLDPREAKGTTFDTPSLRGVYKSAPYLHDGSAANLLEVLTNTNLHDLHGTTSHLTLQELEDLVEFLGSLPYETASVPCVSDAYRLCLQDGRFEVTVRSRLPRQPLRRGEATPTSDAAGSFSFFDRQSIDVVVKILDGRAVNGGFWAFVAPLTHVELWVTMTDAATGAAEVYHKPEGSFCGAADLMAFANAAHPSGRRNEGRTGEHRIGRATALPVDVSAPTRSGPLEQTGSCLSGASTLCLFDNRFEVEAAWIDPRDGSSGSAFASPATDSSGFFWIFDPDNVELALKILDGRALSGTFWVFYGVLTDLELRITVADTLTGETHVYHEEPGDLCGAADTGVSR